jgi:membrane protease YdiL (CAAX protease family)
LLAFTISWLGGLAVAAPHLLRHEPLPKITGILMFPAMLLGPSLSGIFLTAIVAGKTGLRDLRSRLLRARIPARWYAPLLIPPLLVLTVLFTLKTSLSPVYTPNLFLLGVLFGVPAGLLEEIGWTGFAFPRMSAQHNPLGASILLGLLWGLWHLPVVNYLGTATPHGAYWFPFFLAFTLAMTAMRVLICWRYLNTKSVLIAQLNAHKFHRLVGHFQPSRSLRQARSTMVRTLRNRVMARTSHRSQKIQCPPGTLTTLQRCLTRAKRPFSSRIRSEDEFP